MPETTESVDLARAVPEPATAEPGRRGWLLTAGFAQVSRRGVFRPPSVPHMRTWYVALEASR